MRSHEVDVPESTPQLYPASDKMASKEASMYKCHQA
jgi:hypothetical protein